jgi:hypothetical protein
MLWVDVQMCEYVLSEGLVPANEVDDGFAVVFGYVLGLADLGEGLLILKIGIGSVGLFTFRLVLFFPFVFVGGWLAFLFVLVVFALEAALGGIFSSGCGVIFTVFPDLTHLVGQARFPKVYQIVILQQFLVELVADL